jgi:magnesium-transporting ATPase (P-type)
LGGISSEIQTETRQSPLALRLKKLARQISTLGYVLAAIVALVYLFSTFVIDSAFDAEIIKYKLTSIDFVVSHLFHALTVGLTVLVVAVPEGLPMMIAVVLSSNIKRMVKDNVLVRKPVGIEAAGSMNILFTDKTGTLTEGKMSVGAIYLGDGASFWGVKELSSNAALYSSYVLSAYANTSSVVGAKKQALGGNFVDRAILESVLKERAKKPQFDVMSKQEFDSVRKLSVACISYSGQRRLFVKGAPEVLLPRVVSFVDKDGKKRTAYDVVVEQAGFCGSKNSQSDINHSEPASSDPMGAVADDDEDFPFE